MKLHLEASIGPNVLTVCRHERKEWRDAGASTCQETIDDNCDIHRLWTSNSHVDCQSTLQGTYCHLLTNLTPRNFLIPNFDPLKSFGPSQDFHCCWLHIWSADDVTYQFLNRCCDSGPASLVNGARRYKRKCPEWSRAENQQLAGTTVLLLWNVHTQKEQFECANSWSFIPIWPLDLRPLETWTTAEPWFLIADDTQWMALFTRPNRNYKNRLDVDCFNPTWLHRVHQTAHQEDWWCRSVKRSAQAGGR